jgi:DNA-binding PadR family transcriptional regulator
MAMLSVGGLTPRMLVLGLVIQKEDTVAGVDRRLSDQFASARFTPGSAHKNLPSLAEAGYVHLTKPGPPNEPTMGVYAGTSGGVEFHRRWLLRRERPLGIRDVLNCKLEFIEPEDLPWFIEDIREQEEECRRACNVAHGSVIGEHRSRRVQRKPVHWRARMEMIRSKHGATEWAKIADCLETTREDLEELYREILTDGLA